MAVLLGQAVAGGRDRGQLTTTVRQDVNCLRHTGDEDTTQFSYPSHSAWGMWQLRGDAAGMFSCSPAAGTARAGVIIIIIVALATSNTIQDRPPRQEYLIVRSSIKSVSY